MGQCYSPWQIEERSMEIIREELRERGPVIPPENLAVVCRVIHATADLDYAGTLRFSPDAVRLGTAALRGGAEIVTDTNMALAGVSKAALQRLGGRAVCYMADPGIAQEALTHGTTRAAAAMHYAAQQHPGAVLAVGNAPTALLALAEELRGGYRPALVIAAPVGFVNVVESKEQIVALCRELELPCIAAMGRKGGSGVAAAICNALLYTAADLLDPAGRMEKTNG